MFIEPGHSVIDPSASGHAGLSQNVRQQLPDLRATDLSPFDPTDHHPDMRHHRLRPRGARRLGRWTRGDGRCGRGCAAAGGGAALVEVLLLPTPILAAVVSHTAGGGLLHAVGVPAAKGTTQVPALAAGQILAPGITWIGEKEDAAVTTAGQAPSPVRLLTQERSQSLVVLQDSWPDLPPAIPVPGKLKLRRDRYCKKAKLSLRMLTLQSMSSSYRIGTRVSRRWDGDFCRVPTRPTPRLSLPWKQERRVLLPSHWLRLSEQTRLHFPERHRRGVQVPSEAPAQPLK